MPSWMEARQNRPLSGETDPFPEHEEHDQVPSGSAALIGDLDDSPPRSKGLSSLGTPVRQESRDESGFSAFGMTADHSGFRDSFHAREQYPQQTPHQRGASHEPMSPTDTNPYQSPDHDRTEEDIDTDGSDIQRAHLPGLRTGGFGDGAQLPGLGGFGNLGRAQNAFEHAASDRSQTSSTGPRGFSNLGGLGTLPGLGGASAWATTQPAVGTPHRELSGFNMNFGDNKFGLIGGDIQSPSLAGLGSGGPFGTGFGMSGSGTLGRGSKMGSLFPTAMQEQMRSEQGQSANESQDENDHQQGAFGFGRNAFGNNAPGPLRDVESPFRQTRNFFDDTRGSDSPYANTAMSGFGQPGPHQTTTLATSSQNAPSSQRNVSQNIPPTQALGSSASNQPPAAQQKTMVMPDRMRWIYRDPQGNTQGPWSGLEMHDWYKAGFFSPELLVKKYEDPEYEPLAQLIRRIGNSREPFLVPQIGIPHGPPSTQTGNAWAGNATAPSSVSAQPPFASSFPSFGTTLTAEQQNALERRKQEEQYLMARQKEHLAQQQIMLKQMQGAPIGMHSGQLHHHSSAHSLHSQPSFGSVTSPGGYQPSPSQGPSQNQGMPGFFDNSFRMPPGGGLGPIGGNLDM
ncbi:hypothetical protein LTS18_010019, partial [Coniosporium uncinatum]